MSFYFSTPLKVDEDTDDVVLGKDDNDDDNDNDSDDDDGDDDDNFSGCRRASSYLTPLTRCKHALQRWTQKASPAEHVSLTSLPHTHQHTHLQHAYKNSHSHQHAHPHTHTHTHTHTKFLFSFCKTCVSGLLAKSLHGHETNPN